MKKIASIITKENIENLKLICGENGWTDAEDINEKYLSEERNFYKSYSPIILRPDSTLKISNILKYCYKKNIPIVPQGGNTGLVGGTVSGHISNEIILNLEKMNKVRELSHTDSVLIVEAGVKLHEVQSIAKSINKFFPLSLASEGTCQIGGNLATNAGGVHVIKYGNARDLALGLEVVLADGTIINGLKKLRKDNSGYNLNQLFIGSEGTLGIITAASLKLFPIPYEVNTILLALDSLENAIEIMNELKKIKAITLASIISTDLQPILSFLGDNIHVGTEAGITYSLGWQTNYDGGFGVAVGGNLEYWLEDLPFAIRFYGNGYMIPSFGDSVTGFGNIGLSLVLVLKRGE